MSCAVTSLLPSHHLLLPAPLHWDNRQHEIQANVDSGAADIFIDQYFAGELQIPLLEMSHPSTASSPQLMPH